MSFFTVNEQLIQVFARKNKFSIFLKKLLTQKMHSAIVLHITCGVSEAGYRAGLSRRRSRVRAPHIATGSLAQSVEQRTVNPCVAGSSPAGAAKRFGFPNLFFYPNNFLYSSSWNQ